MLPPGTRALTLETASTEPAFPPSFAVLLSSSIQAGFSTEIGTSNLAVQAPVPTATQLYPLPPPTMTPWLSIPFT